MTKKYIDILLGVMVSTLLLLTPISLFSKSKVDTIPATKVRLVNAYDAVALAGAALSGLGRGVTNALRKDQGSLQRYLGVGPYDWGGVNDWERNYEGNKYWNEATNSPNPHKTEIFGNFGRDGWHTADETAKWGDRLGAACFVLGAALDINRVARIEYTSTSARKKAIRRQIIISVAKGITTWTISSLVEKRTFDVITKSK